MPLTTDPQDPRLTHGVDDKPVPQAEVYLVLSKEERAKGFIRPYRSTYRHVGDKPQYDLADLTKEQRERYPDEGYVKFEKYPKKKNSSTIGRYWTQKQLENTGCGAITRMGRELSETYARNPHFYGSTYCVECEKHLPIAEFIWTADGEVVGS